jgi:glutamate formiminotransferase / 5-formyltetrahydrofolate cyclo-ligase
MLECVVNISEGRDLSTIAAIAASGGSACIDVHSDPWHNRSVLTLAGTDVIEAARAVARSTVERCDFSAHEGVHPAIGALDVVPFVPLGPTGFGGTLDLIEAIAARDGFISTIGAELALPCFSYGPERSLPDVRRRAFDSLAPTSGPPAPHPTAGATCVGARATLVAYNVYLVDPDLEAAKAIARSLRSPGVRALGLRVGAEVQVSCNLTQPWNVGPADLVDRIADAARVDHTELVGLVPHALISATPRSRWAELDLSADRTVEARLP